jgi:hypothetical protein
MIYNIPHVKKFGNSWSRLKIQWETVHLPPQCKDGNGGSVFLNVDFLEWIAYNNSKEAFQWMIGDSGTIIWGIKDKKNLGSKKNKARMPVIAIGGNEIAVNPNAIKGFQVVRGISKIDYSITPDNSPYFWHQIYCVTKLKHGVISPPHDTPRGPAFMPILDVSFFKRTKALAAGITYIRTNE